ncbi:hypothetical protein [Labilithrix luteola]|nr:hypothetical protein [Labilithrix luteola]
MLVASQVILSSPRAARADEGAALESLELAWDAPTSCPSREALLEQLSRALGDSRAAVKVHARGRVRRDPSGSFVLSLGIRSGNLDSKRTVKDPSCEVVTAAAVVMVALAIDPAMALRSEPLAPSGEEASEPPDDAPSQPTRTPTPTMPSPGAPPATPGPPRAEVRRPRPTERQSFMLGVGIGPTIELATFGRPTTGALAGIYVSFRDKLRLDVGVIASTPVQMTIEERPAYGIRVSSAGAVARGCFLPISLGVMQVGPCAGLDFTTARASGFGTAERRSDEARWFAVGAGLLGRERLSPSIHFVESVYGTLPLEAPQYGLQIGDVAYRVHSVSLGVRVTLAIEVTIF